MAKVVEHFSKHLFTVFFSLKTESVYSVYELFSLLWYLETKDVMVEITTGFVHRIMLTVYLCELIDVGKVGEVIYFSFMVFDDL